MFGKRIIREKEKMPRGWGKAYWDFKIDRPIMEKVCYPIPINLIVGLSRRIYYAMTRGLSPSIFDREIHRRIKDGSDAQWDSGFECGKYDKGLYMPVVEVSKSHGTLKIASINALNLKGKSLQLEDQEWYEIGLMVKWDDESKTIHIENEKVFLIKAKRAEEA